MSWGTKIVSSKYAVVVIVIITAILLSGFGRDNAHADTDLVTDLAHSPDPVVINQSVEVSDVDKVIMNMCTEIVCFPPITMVKGTDDVWRATSSDVNEAVLHHYNITILFTDGTRDWTDDVYFTPVTSDLEVKFLEHAPGNVIIGEEVDIYTELADDTGVTDVTLQHCRGDVCFTPVQMTQLDNGTYHARVGPFDTDEEIKYNVTVTYDNGHKAWTEDLKFSPSKKVDDNGDDDDNGIIPALGAVAAIAVLAGFGMTRRGKKGKG
jgi:hypothetical protein